MSTRRKGISLPDLQFLKFGPDPDGPEKKYGAAAEAGRHEVEAMEAIAQIPFGGHEHQRFVRTDVRIDPVADTHRAAVWVASRITEANRLPPGKMSSEIVTITPILAAAILANHNRGNRKLRESRVDAFVRKIKDGRWRLHSQGISFSRDGHLNNGQHRLNGIIKSGHAVEVYVTWGEDRDVFDVLDTGSVRGGSDALSIKGYQNTPTLAASARLLNLIETGSYGSPLAIDNDEIGDIVDENRGLVVSASAAHGLGSKLRCSSAALTVAFYEIERHSKKKEKLGGFIALLKDGNIPDARDPILVLRDGLIKKTIDKGARNGVIKAVTQYACVINAWNKHIRGRKGLPRWEHPDPLPVVE